LDDDDDEGVAASAPDGSWSFGDALTTAATASRPKNSRIC
jgi:hypothetical protein